MKISILGIDKAGKSSLVENLDAFENLETIHLTYFHCYKSPLARYIGYVVSRMVKPSERFGLKSVTGLFYLLHLLSFKLEERHLRRSPVLILDRDPIIDTLCYSAFYAPQRFGKRSKALLTKLLEFMFTYPDYCIFLDVSPATSAARTSKDQQLHETPNTLQSLSELFEAERIRMEKRGVKILRINTDNNSTSEVSQKVKDLLKINCPQLAIA